MILQNSNVKLSLQTVIVIFLCIFWLNGYCQTTSNRKNLVLKAQKLKELQLLLTDNLNSNSKKIYQQQFFDEFPNSFKELNEIYGYNNDTAAILYSVYHEHIFNLFNKINSINDTLYYTKIASIARYGHWDADAVNDFQIGLRKRVVDKPELIVFILKSKNKKEIKSFWSFYFDEPHPETKISESIKKIKKIDPEIYELLVQAHKDVLKNKE